MDSVVLQEETQDIKDTFTEIINNELCNINWILRKDKPIEGENTRTLSLIDLYSGCGGMTLGVKEALRIKNIGLQIKLALDMDKAALEVYKKNFLVSDDIALGIDINDLVSINIGEELLPSELELQEKYKDLDILVAGPPCQGHSNLNNHTRRSDPRNNLYLNAVRVVEILKPKIAIIENVSTVIHDKDNVVDKAKIAMQNLGYTIYSSIINVSKYGLAQTRKRHFQIAILKSTLQIDLKSFLTQNSLPISSYIGDIVNEHKVRKGIFYKPSVTKNINKDRIDYLFKNNLYDLPNNQRPNCHKDKKHSYKSCYGRMHWDKPAQTITSGFGSMGQGRYVHPLQKRVITPHEAARIQGFPDFFDFTSARLRGDLHTMIANAVPPKIIAMIINQLINKSIL